MKNFVQKFTELHLICNEKHL